MAMMMKQSISPTRRYAGIIAQLCRNHVTLILLLAITNLMTNHLCECLARQHNSLDQDNHNLNSSFSSSNYNSVSNTNSDNRNLTLTQDSNVHNEAGAQNETEATSTSPFVNEIEEFEKLLLDYVNDAFDRNFYELVSGVTVVKDNKTGGNEEGRSSGRSFDDKLITAFRNFAKTHVINVNLQRTAESGRLFFFKGFKKIMWPLLFGLQFVKTILLVLFLPSIIGSLGKIVGKGLTSVSGFSNHAQTVDDLEFKDNGYGEQDNFTQTDYSYPVPDASSNSYASQMYDSASVNNALSRYGFGGQKVQYVNSPIDYSKHAIAAPKKDEFKIFHDIPSSSLLLTNYDPFYSPLLSRLDSVFQQMNIGSTEEKCREKLICLMYANPAKYAPFSNLVSAQLSRELNELKKPTSDNTDILRFFKYMRAAKDGQDGIACDTNYQECTTLKESQNPAMIHTFNDINKLVHARKLH